MPPSDDVKLCNDYGDAPHCLGEIDEQYTMDFTDIGEGYIYWCSKCGSLAHAMQGAIEEAFETREGFTEDFRSAIETALAEQKQGEH